MSEGLGHNPVLMQEAVDALAISGNGAYIDATFGGGGHARAILAELRPTGRLLVFDRDPDAIGRAEMLQREIENRDRLQVVHASFAEIQRQVESRHFGPVDGVLFDLGVSSFQLDNPERGFSFLGNGPLDMRFDTSLGESAFDLVNGLEAVSLADLIWRYGEERRSRAIAAALVREREVAPVATTGQLAEIVENAVGGRRGSRTHPATQTFQALRMAVNRELESLDEGLQGAVEVLAPGGRLVVISFHSLEDRSAKQFFRRESAHCLCPPEQPICTCHHHPRLRIVGKKVRPTPAELAINSRARSAVMRVAERLPQPESENHDGIA